MEITIEKSLTTIDEKSSLQLLEEFRKIRVSSKQISSIELNNHRIWIVNDFLHKSECDEIVKSCETHGFKKLEGYSADFRDSERLLAFDKNGVLLDTINDRLGNVLTEISQEEKIRPYGFFSDQYVWSDIMGINECLRVSKYHPGSKGFGYHRDAQYTSNNIRSAYTILIYLSDSNNDGQLEFVAPNNIYPHEGLTMSEEMKLIGTNCENYQIVPKKGMAVIFDQRLIHRALGCKNAKYVIRTDLLTEGTKKSTYRESKLQRELKELTQKLFRQAQYNELLGTEQAYTKSKELYEICISLRQNPQKIKVYPKHLEKLLEDMPVNVPIVDSNYTLNLFYRNGYQYVFKYDNIEKRADFYNALRVCATVLLSTIVSKLTSEQISYSDYLQKAFPEINVVAFANGEPEDENEMDDCDGQDSNEGNFEEYYKKKYGYKPKQHLKDGILDLRYEEYLTEKYGLKLAEVESPNSEKSHINMTVKVKKYEDRQNRHCGLSDDSSSDTEEYEYNAKETFTYNYDNFGIEFEPLSETEGNMIIKTKADMFNHASCQCERYLKYVKTESKSVPVQIKISYIIFPEEKEIELSCIPTVIV